MSKGSKPTAIEILIKQADTNLIKDLTKLFNRIEKIFIPSGTLVYDEIFDRLQALFKEIQKGSCLVDVKEFTKAEIDKTLSKNSELILRKIDWDIFTKDLIQAAGNGTPEYTLPNAVLEEIEREKSVHDEKLKKGLAKEKIRQLQVRNNQPIMQGKWRKEPFTARVYEPISDYVVTNSISEQEGKGLLEMLHTPLNGYLGQAYNYDDHGLTEEWMTTFSDRQTSAPSDKDVIRTQLVSLLEIMMVQVQDRVCTEEKVLEREPLVLGKDVKEVPVWGIDCYTRRMVELAIEDRVAGSRGKPLVIKRFIEKRLLPAINQQPIERAHNMKDALTYLLEQNQLSDVDRSFCEATLQAVDEFGGENFRIHPKGTGVVCIRPDGIPAHVLVTEYLGELYPPYRWCEKLDVVEQAQEKFELKPTLPDFYNILLERPRQDPDGYGLLYVDASQRANIGSSCSHSCDSNCTSAVVARRGKLTIVLTTNRHISYGEELTMDYYSITTSDVEWRAAICLCGMKSCRGSFLHYATQDELQQILNQNYGPLWRYASLLRACSSIPISAEDRATLARHGIQKVALGSNPPNWVIKYVADILRFIEYERKALPCALLRKNDDSDHYSYSNADMDARSVMEQRIQSMICCISMATRIVCNAEQKSLQHACPLSGYSPTESIAEVFERIRIMPALLEEHLLKPLQEHGEDPKKAKNADPVPVKIEKIQQVLTTIRLLVEEVPKGMAKLREIILTIRSNIMQIEQYSTPVARLNQLSDILVLWAYTTNFSSAREYLKLTADPITVVARELGTSIPRSKIFDAYRETSRHRSSNKSTKVPKSKSSDDGSSREENGKAFIEDEGWADTTTESIDSPSPMPMDVMNDVVAENSFVPTIINEGNNLSLDVSVEEQHTTEIEQPASSRIATPIVAEETEVHAERAELTKETKIAAHSKRDFYLSPNEPVFMGSKVYSPLFCFWQLLGWFNAGTDQKIVAPELFGCTQLPEPIQCFGTSEAPYGEKQRDTLLSILMDEKLQTMPWPQTLKASFSTLPSKKKALYGSPMLDIALGQVDAVMKVLRELKFQTAMNSAEKQHHHQQQQQKPSSHSGGKKMDLKKGSKSKGKDAIKLSFEEATQYDNILPPELPTNWVQCESCKKWRRVAWHVDADTLPELWECSMNSWDIDNATCTAPQDSYDPQKENTFELKSSLSTNTLEKSCIGDWRDVYCVKNLVYYEAQIKKIKTVPVKKGAGGGGGSQEKKTKLLFHYKGWSPKFDEWIDYDSERIQPHHLFTNPDADDPRKQEAWQGLSPIKSVIRSAISLSSVSTLKKRKSDEGGSSAAASKRRQIVEEDGKPEVNRHNDEEEGVMMEVEE